MRPAWKKNEYRDSLSLTSRLIDSLKSTGALVPSPVFMRYPIFLDRVVHRLHPFIFPFNASSRSSGEREKKKTKRATLRSRDIIICVSRVSETGW